MSPLATLTPQRFEQTVVDRIEIRCAGCGYGGVVSHIPGRCPMCGGAAWQRRRRGDRDSAGGTF